MRTKISSHNWEHQIKFNDGSTTLLVIEDSDTFRKYITELKSQIEGLEGDFAFSNEKDSLSFKDRFAIITNPLQVDFTDKRIQTKITSLMKNRMSNETHYEAMTTVLSQLESFAQDLEMDFPFEVEHSEPDIQALVKMFGFSLKLDYQDEIDKLSEYTNVLHDVCGIDHFVFVSMFAYFNERTIQTFIRECNANKHNLLFVERYDQTVENASQKILIDHDLCEIFE